MKMKATKKLTLVHSYKINMLATMNELNRIKKITSILKTKRRRKPRRMKRNPIAGATPIQLIKH